MGDNKKRKINKDEMPAEAPINIFWECAKNKKNIDPKMIPIKKR